MPTVAEAEGVAQWYTTQAGVTAMTLALVCIALMVAIVKLFNWFNQRFGEFRKDIKDAFAKIDTHEAEEKANSALVVASIGQNTIALARVGEKIDIDNRRGPNRS